MRDHKPSWQNKNTELKREKSLSFTLSIHLFPSTEMLFSQGLLEPQYSHHTRQSPGQELHYDLPCSTHRSMYPIFNNWL